MKPEERRVVALLVGGVLGLVLLRRGWIGALVGAVAGVLVDGALRARARAASGRAAGRAGPATAQAPAADARADEDVLGVPRGSSVEDVKTRFRDLAKKYHPDRFQGASPQFKDAAESEFKRIREAYERVLARHGEKA